MSKVLINYDQLCGLADYARRVGTIDALADVALQWAGQADKEMERLTAERDQLRKFVGRVLGEARQYMSDIDGGDVQAWAVECDLLEEWTATEPCGEQCECAEVADFPARCYRLTETGKAAIGAAKEQR
jgi:hypothetical protein